MIISNFTIIEENLLAIITDIEYQSEIGLTYPVDAMNFQDQIEMLREFIVEAGEYGPAYESIVATLEQYPFRISGPNAIKLLEIGLIFGFKTTLPKDILFDCRK